MNYKTHYSKRIIALVICAVISLSTVSNILGSLTQAVSPSDYTVYDNTTNIVTTTNIATKPATLMFDKGTGPSEVSTTHINTLAKLNDNNFTNTSETMIYGALCPFIEVVDGASSTTKNTAEVKKAYDDGSRVLYITLPLSFAADINNILVVNHSNSILRTAWYELFASDSESTLYDGTNSIVDYKNTESKQIQNFKINSGVLSGKKFVGMKVYSPANSWEDVTTANGAGNFYARFLEFNVYGTRTTFGAPAASDGTLPSGTNVLSGRKPTITMYDDTTSKSDSITNDIATITDDKTDKSLEIKGTNVSYAKYNSGTNLCEVVTDGTVYTDISFKLNGTLNLEKLYVANDLKEAFRTGKYQIFASKNADSLFTDENLLNTIQNTSKDLATTITFATPLKDIRAIGIRVFSPCSDYTSSDCTLSKETVENGTHNIFPRISEIAAYGTFVKDPVVKLINSDKAQLPDSVSLSGLTNVTAGAVPQISLTDTIAGATTKPNTGSLSNISDENYSTETMIYGFFADWDEENNQPIFHHNDDTRYCDVYYDLKTIIDLKYIVISNHSTKEMVTGEYGVYISNDLDTLYNDENLYTTVDNVTTYENGGTNRMNVINFDPEDSEIARSGRYVGIRINNPICAVAGNVVVEMNAQEQLVNRVYPRIMDFSIYGTYQDPLYNPDIYAPTVNTTNVDLSKLESNYGKNLLKEANPNFKLDGKKFTPMWMKTQGQHYGFNDMMKKSDGTNHVDLSEHQPGTTLDIYFKIPQYDYTKIKGFAYQGSSLNWQQHWTEHYQVYVAEELDDLYTTQSLVYEYNAANAGLQKGQLREFDEGKEPIGTYIGFRFLDACHEGESTSCYSRISLLYVWGEEHKKVGKPSNLAENMPIEAFFNNSGKLTEVSESDLTVDEVANLTDSNNDTSATINTKGSNRDTLEIIYNLCSDSKVDSINISAEINSTTGFKRLKVYGANSFAEVNEESSLLWTHTPSSSGTINPQKIFSTSKTMRYIRFVFEDTKNSVKINELYVNGLDTQKLKTRKITNTVEPASILFRRTNIESNITDYVSISNAANLLDNDQYTSVSLKQGVVSEDKYDVIVPLGDLKTVSNINFRILRNLDNFRPRKVNVYIGETEADIDLNSDVKPSYSFDVDDYVDGAVSKQIRPRLARYVRFELLDFEKCLIGKQDDGKYRITCAIADIIVTGTNVKGMQTSETSEELIKFTDKKTGITATIMRMDTNDIFADATGIKVTTSTATNWQMDSLRGANLLVVGKKVYDIEFVDLYGNPVTNIGRRIIKLSFKTPKGFEGALALIGNANHRKLIEAVDTFENSGIITTELTWENYEDHKYAILGMTTADDPYWNTIGELEDFPEDVPTSDTEDGESNTDEYADFNGIVTTDRRFTVSLQYTDIPNKTKFIAKDITKTISEDDLSSVLEFADGGKVAVAYNINMLQDGGDFNIGEDILDVYYAIPSFVKDNYTDLRVFSFDETGYPVELYSSLSYDNPDELFFQTNLGDIVITGYADEASVDFDYGDYTIDGTGGTVYEIEPDVEDTAPETGESATLISAMLMIMLAAGFVLFTSAKQKEY